MPSLVLTGETVAIRSQSRHIQVIRRGESGKANDFIRMDVPLHDVDRVIVEGRPDLTTPALQKFMFNGIPVFFMTAKGRWIGALNPDNNMNAERRIRQYQLATNREFALKVAKRVVYAKIRNARRVLQRLAANRKLSEEANQQIVMQKMVTLLKKSKRASSMDELRGIEGMAAAVYFARLRSFFPENVPFNERSRRPPKDAANALLSWTYTIVLGEVESAIRAQGLDPCIGFLHAVSHGSPSLALDLIEPLRGPCCDLLALHLLNHKVLDENSFEFHSDDGGVYLKQDVKKDFFYSYEFHMTRQFTPKKDMPHTDFRGIIKKQVLNVLKAMENHEHYEFFHMP